MHGFDNQSLIFNDKFFQLFILFAIHNAEIYFF